MIIIKKQNDFAHAFHLQKLLNFKKNFMRISFLKVGTGQSIELNRLIEENSVEVNKEKAVYDLMKTIGNSKYVFRENCIL